MTGRKRMTRTASSTGPSLNASLCSSLAITVTPSAGMSNVNLKSAVNGGCLLPTLQNFKNKSLGV